MPNHNSPFKQNFAKNKTKTGSDLLSTKSIVNSIKKEAASYAGSGPVLRQGPIGNNKKTSNGSWE